MAMHRNGPFLRAARRAWSLITRRAAMHPANVIVPDPGASLPKDLDAPFHDPKAQRRVGELIARTASMRSSSH
jgi:hypothetical protein